MFKLLNSYGANNVVQLSCTIKLRCFLKKPAEVDIIEAKEFYIQLYFVRYKGKLVVRFYSPTVYIVQHVQKLRGMLNVLSH